MNIISVIVSFSISIHMINMCSNISEQILLCQNVSTISENNQFPILIFQDSPHINFTNFNKNISTIIFLNQVPDCYTLSKLQFQFQITTFPNCIYKLPTVVPQFQSEKSILILFFLLFLLLVYSTSCFYMLIKVGIY